MNKDLIMVFSDAHLRDVGSFAPFNRIEENGLSRELNNIIEGFRFVAESIKQLKPGAVFFLGDLYHTPEGLTTKVIHGSAIALGLIRDACFEVDILDHFYMMPGNHDFENDKLGITSISTLCGFCNLILDNQLLSLPHMDNYRIGIVQYSTDKTDLAETLSTTAGQCDLMMTHLDYKGARYETGRASNSQISPIFDIPVISGDIHIPQIVGSVTYPGSLIQNRFNRTDMNQVGGILTFDKNTKEISRYPNTMSKHYVKIENLGQIKGLDPSKCVLQVRCPIPDKQHEDMLNGFEYVYVPLVQRAEQQDGPKTVTNVDRPETLFRDFVNEGKPEAMAMFDEVMGG